MSSKAHTQIRTIRTSSVAAIAQGSTDMHADTSDTGKIRSSRRVWKRRQHRDTSDTDKFRSSRRARKRRHTRRHEQYGQVPLPLRKEGSTVTQARTHTRSSHAFTHSICTGASTHTHKQHAQCIHSMHSPYPPPSDRRRRGSHASPPQLELSKPMPYVIRVKGTDTSTLTSVCATTLATRRRCVQAHTIEHKAACM